MIDTPTTSHIKWLLLTLALILLLHAGNLPLWVTIVSALFGVWRYMIFLKSWPKPKLYVLAPITILIGVGILLTFKGQIGRETCIALLVVMLSLKLLETNTRRDFYLVVILAYFVVGNLFLFNQSMLTFLISIPPLILLTATLIHLNSRATRKLLTTIKYATRMLLQAVPLMLLLFILFPRIPGPLWSLPQHAHGGIGLPGLSDSIKFNQVSQNATDTSVAFRVKFKDKVPPQSQLYWRGPVLWTHLNNEWKIARQSRSLRQEPLTSIGPAIEYSITLEPHNQKWLLMLDMPSRLPAFAAFTHDYSAISKEPIYTRIRYDVTSHSQYRLGGKRLNSREKRLSLQLDDDENPRTVALGEQWFELSAEETIHKALSLFREKDFYYTLNPPILGKNPIDDFLFNTKRGFCEHYAISFVTLMRAAGLPARVVTGYQGGELNPNDNFLIVRQMDAHAWAEVWLKDKGWVRVDPTAAVSPIRVERGIAEAARVARPVPGQTQPESSNLPLAVQAKQYPLLHSSLLKWDSINNSWNQWVIGYNQNKQQSILGQITGKKVSSATLLIWLICATMLLGAIASLIIYQKNQAKLNRAQQLYAQFIRKLRHFYLQPQPQEAASTFAQRAAQVMPRQRDQLMAIAQAYNALQYGRYNSPEHKSLIMNLEKLIRQFNLKK